MVIRKRVRLKISVDHDEIWVSLVFVFQDFTKHTAKLDRGKGADRFTMGSVA